MTILKDVIVELFSMFAGDARLSAAVLGVVVVAAILIKVLAVDPAIGGGLMLLGCLALVVESVRRASNRARRR